jgi:hypothetical protein
MTDKDVFTQAAEAAQKSHPPRMVVALQDKADMDQAHRATGTDDMTPPLNWKPCSPDLLNSGVDCATAPRWAAGPIGEHYHPPVDVPALIIYQVGDYDIVAAFNPQGAIDVLCGQTREGRSAFELCDVVQVEDKHLDAMELFSLRLKVAKLTEPTYLYGLE